MPWNAISRRAFGAIVVAAALLAARLPAAAQDSVDLELVLAVDISRSMEYDEQIVQRNGYAAAFRSDQVIEAILGGGTGRIAVVYMEWASDGMTNIVVPWTLIDSRRAALAFADALEGQKPRRMSRTSISGALLRARQLFEENAWSGLRRTVDVSGDGPNNHGEPVEKARDLLVSQGIVINGLPLMVHEATPGYGITNLDEYYSDCVIGGTGAFVVPVQDWKVFEPAVRRKLVLEIAGNNPKAMPAAMVRNGTSAAAQPKVDCMIGEKLWLRRWHDFELR